jgi:hypothetical protein
MSKDLRTSSYSVPLGKNRAAVASETIRTFEPKQSRISLGIYRIPALLSFDSNSTIDATKKLLDAHCVMISFGR